MEDKNKTFHFAGSSAILKKSIQSKNEKTPHNWIFYRTGLITL